MADKTVFALWAHYRTEVMGPQDDRGLVMAAELGFFAGARAMMQHYHETLMAYHRGQIGVDEVMARYASWICEFEAQVGAGSGAVSTERL